MHLMPSTTLLTASLHYGVVARSYPLTGKVLRGFLDATGTANGLGLGNPNAEFSPHVTAIALASEGRTAKVLWGFRNGEVAVTIANRAMDGSRASAAKHVRCNVNECHEGAVRDVAWAASHGADGPPAFVTGAADGRIKLWDARRVKCLWSSERGLGLVADPYIKVAIDFANGTLAGATESGDIVVWSGLSPICSEEASNLHVVPQEIRITSFPPVNVPTTPAGTGTQRELSDLYPTHVGGHPSVLVVYKNDSYFYRVSIDLQSSEVERVAFGDGSSGFVRCLKPVFATQDGESTFIAVGYELGCISIFDWDARPTAGGISVVPSKQFEAHEDGAVTALAWNSIVLVSGSARGTVKAWDSLSFEPLRAFASPAARPAVGGEWDGVGQILLERDVLVASVGSKVLAWKAGPVTHDKGNVKGKQSRVSKITGVAKWQQQLEMYRDIAESRRDLEEEQTHTRLAFGREREQQSTLAHLGLSEVEAVEYVLMLSRDEEERRRITQPPSMVASGAEEEGVFMADFDDVGAPMSGHANPAESGLAIARSSRASSSLSAQSSSSNSVVLNGRSQPRTLPSGSNQKIQVSPRMRPEPMEAGFSTSPLGGSLSSVDIHSRIAVPDTSDPDHFPPVSRTPSSTGASDASTPGSPLTTWRSVSGSPESFRSAWSTQWRERYSSSGPSPPNGFHTSSPPNPPSRVLANGPSLLTAAFVRENVTNGESIRQVPVREELEGEDADLRFAIELSLAEARSRGDAI